MRIHQFSLSLYGKFFLKLSFVWNDFKCGSKLQKVGTTTLVHIHTSTFRNDHVSLEIYKYLNTNQKGVLIIRYWQKW